MSLAESKKILEKTFEDKVKCRKLGEVLKLSLREYLKVMFFRQNSNQFIFKPFHNKIIQGLQDLADGKTNERNLSIQMPVGWGKSIIVEYFITWCFARSIEHCFCYVSHSDRLISRLSKECKDIICSEDYIKLFDIYLKKDDRSKINFSFESAGNRTGLTAGALGSGITGLDAGNPTMFPYGGSLIIDDPLDAGKSRSIIELEKVISDYDDKLATRRRGSHIGTILIMQRLSKNDLVEWTLNNQKSEWKYITIPAFKNEKSQWEEKNSTDELNRISLVNPYKFASQYQQQPLIAGGEMIKTEWFRFYTGEELSRKAIRKCFITSDTAMTVKEHSDYSVLAFWATDNANLYLIDIVRGKWDGPTLRKMCKTFWGKHKNGIGRVKTSSFYMENKSSGITMIQDLKADSRIPIIPIPRGGKGSDKITRLENVLSYIESGMVMLPETKEYAFNPEFLNESENFTRDNTHRHDDQVDAMVDAIDVFRGSFRKEEKDKFRNLPYLTNGNTMSYNLPETYIDF